MPLEFLTLAEVRESTEEIRAAFEQHMTNPSLAAKKNARQWQYLRMCLEQTLGAPSVSLDLRPLQIAQYKFEVEYKLRRLYLRGGQPFAFVFRLVSRRDAAREQLVVDDDYPEIGGYYLLVRDRRDSSGIPMMAVSTNREHIEMVVAACIDAEFEAYQALPAIDEAKLLRWLTVDGPAYKDLIHILKRVLQRSWTITNPHNPSTKRLISIDVKNIQIDKATAKTKEYWYLKWWGNNEGTYRYPYRETCSHTYFLVKQNDTWLVEENVQPPPLSSTPHKR